MSDKSRVARKGPIKIRLNPNKTITTYSYNVGPNGKKYNEKRTSETVRNLNKLFDK